MPVSELIAHSAQQSVGVVPAGQVATTYQQSAVRLSPCTSMDWTHASGTTLPYVLLKLSATA